MGNVATEEFSCYTFLACAQARERQTRRRLDMALSGRAGTSGGRLRRPVPRSSYGPCTAPYVVNVKSVYAC
jgi:hypothetical protein